MSELTIEDYKIRLILLNEWKSKTNIVEATKIINERLGNGSIDSIEVQKWFNEFDNGNTSIFDKDSNFNVFIRDKSNEQLNSLLFLSDEKYDEFKLIKCDDRFIEYYFWIQGKHFIVRYDLFFDVKRVVEIPFDYQSFEMIGDDGFLLSIDQDEKKLNLIKLDFENLTFNSVDSIECNEWINSILVDRLNPLNFVIFMGSKDKFTMGKIRKEKLILDDIRNIGDIDFYFANRLMGSKLQGFNYNKQLKAFKFCEFDLGTMEETKIDVPFDLDDDVSLDIGFFWPETYCWSKNCFYVMLKINDKRFHLLMLNLDELKWTDIQIVADRPRNMFVDSNDVLTLKVGDYYDEISAFYRFNLREPDTLKNLVRLFIFRQSTLFGNDKYFECVKRLFITNCDLFLLDS